MEGIIYFERERIGVGILVVVLNCRMVYMMWFKYYVEFRIVFLVGNDILYCFVWV